MRIASPFALAPRARTYYIYILNVSAAHSGRRVVGTHDTQGATLPFIHIFDNPQHLTFAEEIVKSCFESCISWT